MRAAAMLPGYCAECKFPATCRSSKRCLVPPAEPVAPPAKIAAPAPEPVPMRRQAETEDGISLAGLSREIRQLAAHIQRVDDHGKGRLAEFEARLATMERQVRQLRVAKK